MIEINWSFFIVHLKKGGKCVRDLTKSARIIYKRQYLKEKLKWKVVRIWNGYWKLCFWVHKIFQNRKRWFEQKTERVCYLLFPLLFWGHCLIFSKKSTGYTMCVVSSIVSWYSVLLVAESTAKAGILFTFVEWLMVKYCAHSV